MHFYEWGLCDRTLVRGPGGLLDQYMVGISRMNQGENIHNQRW
jgi:hypothetical protein